MGYFGLNDWVESDRAADLCSGVVSSMIKTLKKGLKEKGNSFNTSGPENVALFIEAFIKPNIGNWAELNSDELYDIVTKTRESLEKTIKDAIRHKEDWEGDSLQSHLRSYRRMLKSVKYVQSRLEDE